MRFHGPATRSNAYTDKFSDVGASESPVNQGLSEKLTKYILLAVLAVATLFVHGYHPYVEDAEIYLPGIEHILNPALFPVGQEWFQSHANMTMFPNLVAMSLRVTHLPFETGLLLWHLASIVLLLLACWDLSGLCFPSKWARWGSVALVASLLSIPVAGTALYIMDQYLNPRNLAAFAGLFAVARTLESKYVLALLWLVAAACVHPLMWTYPFSFCVLLVVMTRYESRLWPSVKSIEVQSGVACLVPLAIPLTQSTPAYHEAAKLHAYFYIQHWAWYELLGLVAPVGLFWWFNNIAGAKGWTKAARLCRAFIIYDVIYIVAALVVDLPQRFESLARLQPLRSLHLLYMVMFIMMGGLLGEFVLKNRAWRWLVLFVPLCAGMYMTERAMFPASATVEWPGRTPKNPWAQAFVWVRQNTPTNAVFAMDPNYMHVEGEDEIGFRCLAQRARLADAIKDNGVVSMFPPLADRWLSEVHAQTPWNKLGLEDFARLKKNYGANWLILQQPGVAGLECPYENSAVRVCRIPCGLDCVSIGAVKGSNPKGH